MDRIDFAQKYKALASSWNIDATRVVSLAAKYDLQYQKELDKLGTHGLTLPPYFKDRRKPSEYIYDLLDGWVIEDIICDIWLKTRLEKYDGNVRVKTNGADKDRVVQFEDSRNISTKPDYVFELNGKNIEVELQMARKSLKGYDMKVPKVNRAIKNNSCFLWVIIPENKYFIVNPAQDMRDLEPVSNPLWGGKMVYHIDQEFIRNNGGYGEMSQDLKSIFFRKLGLAGH